VASVLHVLDATRRSRKIKDIIIVRLEQMAPFPHDLIADSLSYYPAAEVVSKRNPTTSVHGLLCSLAYFGRPRSGVTTTALYKIHTSQEPVVERLGIHVVSPVMYDCR